MTRRLGVAPQDCGDPEVTWLTARAVALLVILRSGDRSISSIAAALGETKRCVVNILKDEYGLGLWSRSLNNVSLTDAGRDWIARSGCAL